MSRPTSIMVISDTHEVEKTEESWPIFEAQKTKVDVLLHCGDLTQVGGLSAYKKALRLLEGFNADLKLVIAGNHDISLDGDYWKTHLEEDDEPGEHDEAVEIMTGPLAKSAGVTYLTEGLHRFTLKDGRTFSVYASPYQPECGDWAFSYHRSEDRFSASPAAGETSIAQLPIPDGVDIVTTHGPPRGVLDAVPDKNEHAGCDSLLNAVQHVRPLLHCFGHIHEGHGTEVKRWGARGSSASCPTQKVKIQRGGTGEEAKVVDVARGHDTVMVNAAMMDEKNIPSQAPWIVELQL